MTLSSRFRSSLYVFRSSLYVLVILLLLPTPASAQESNPLSWGAGAGVADKVSTVAVWMEIGAQLVHDIKSDAPKHALGCSALRMGLTIAAAEATKRLVRRWRPDMSDRHSFYSEHTALAWVNTGWRFQVSVPIAIGTGYLRPAANRHYATDVLVGATVGFVTRYACD